MAKYYCTNCKFKAMKETKPDSCNYCGEQGTMVEEHSAEEILEM